MVFLTTKHDKGKIRVVPLSNQKNKRGEEINATYYVSCDKSIRTAYSIGSVFVVDDLVKRVNFYDSVGEMKVLFAEAPGSDRASKEQFEAYNRYLSSAIGETMSAPEEEKKPKRRVVSFVDKIMANPAFKPPTLEEDEFYVDTDTWYLLIRNITNQISTMLIGPTGTGKTEIVELISKKMEKSLQTFDMGSMYDPISGLQGTHRLKKGGESYFDYARFTHAIQQPCNILLDELSRAPVTTTNILFPVLDRRRTLYVEAASEDVKREISVNKDCCFIATANVGAEYTGTNQMDRALVGRFFPLELDYPPKNHEVNVLKVRTGIDTDAAVSIVSTLNNIRSLYKKGSLQSTVSTREALMTAQMVRDGYTVLKALEFCLLPMFDNSSEDSERTKVRTLLMSR